MFRTILFGSAKPQLHVVSTNQIIKPSSPTPTHLKRYNLSIVDQIAPNRYIPIIFYYLNKLPNNQEDTVNQLKLSLSETLSKYYPLAGRLNNSGTYVDCNDEGVDVQEINANCELSEILKRTDNDAEAKGLLLPDRLDIRGSLNHTSPLLVIRLMNFKCGGVSIAVCLSHKLADATSFSTFMNSWSSKMQQISSSTLSTNQDLEKYNPHFISYPPTSHNGATNMQELPLAETDMAIRKFVFPNSEITKLKEAVSNESRLQHITRVEIVTALLSKCVLDVTTAKSGCFKPTVVMIPVNTRAKMSPPLPEVSMGNHLSMIFIPIANKSETNLKTLVEKFKKAKDQKIFDASAHNSKILEFASKNYNFFLCSSFCGIKFYGVDFGWGNPSRVALADTVYNNFFMLMDMPDGDGIEALVSLDKNDMHALQGHREIQAFASANSLV